MTSRSRLDPGTEDVLDSVRALGSPTVRQLIDHTGRARGAVYICVSRLARLGLIEFAGYGERDGERGPLPATWRIK